MTLTYGSLFSGYGGLDRGVQAVLPGRTAWHVEFDQNPSRILAHHWPDVPNYGDVTTVDWENVEPVDVLTGGYPCQPFSHAGNRRGTNDDRHLWPHVAEAVAVLRPGLCVFENVRGHLSLGFDQVLRDLHQLDYDVHWYSLRAADIGAAHGRMRLFIFAKDRHNENPASIGDAETPGRDPHRGVPLGLVVGAGGRPVRAGGVHGEAAGVRPDARGAYICPPELVRADARLGLGAGRREEKLFLTPVAAEGVKPSNTMGVARRQATGEVFLTNQIVTLCGLDPTEPKPREVGRRWGDYAPAIARWEHLMGRPAPAPTCTGKNGKPQLSAAFCEWLMGLPAGHVTDPAIGISRANQLKALGNGVVPHQAAAATAAWVQDMRQETTP